MSDYQPIDCNDYDFLEIACMDRYEVEVQLDSETVVGTADGLETTSGAEYLCLRVRDEQIEKVRIDRIQRIDVITRPARFEHHEFLSGD